MQSSCCLPTRRPLNKQRESLSMNKEQYTTKAMHINRQGQQQTTISLRAIAFRSGRTRRAQWPMS
eukprot:3775909-Lingulodinium_polyedra.AAC.1